MTSIAEPVTDQLSGQGNVKIPVDDHRPCHPCSHLLTVVREGIEMLCEVRRGNSPQPVAVSIQSNETSRAEILIKLFVRSTNTQQRKHPSQIVGSAQGAVRGWSIPVSMVETPMSMAVSGGSITTNWTPTKTARAAR